MNWDAYVHLAFDEIRLAGAGSPQVTRRLKAALTRSQVDRRLPDRVAVLDEQLDLLAAATETAMEDERTPRWRSATTARESARRRRSTDARRFAKRRDQQENKRAFDRRSRGCLTGRDTLRNPAERLCYSTHA